MAEEKCGYCDDHKTRGMKIEQNCQAIAKVQGDVKKLNEELHGPEGLFTTVALMKQMMQNLKWPLVIITAAAIAQLVRIFFTAAPAVKALAGG